MAVADPFGCRCLNSQSLLRCHVPRIEPGVRVSRIRLAAKVHACVRDRRRGSHFSGNRPKRPSNHGLQYQHGPSLGFLCLACHHLPNRYRTCALIVW